MTQSVLLFTVAGFRIWLKVITIGLVLETFDEFQGGSLLVTLTRCPRRHRSRTCC